MPRRRISGDLAQRTLRKATPPPRVIGRRKTDRCVICSRVMFCRAMFHHARPLRVGRHSPAHAARLYPRAYLARLRRAASGAARRARSSSAPIAALPAKWPPHSSNPTRSYSRTSSESRFVSSHAHHTQTAHTVRAVFACGAKSGSIRLQPRPSRSSRLTAEPATAAASRTSRRRLP